MDKKIFDLNNYSFFNKSVQQNLDKLYEDFGEKFIIKKNNIVFDVILEKISFSSNKKKFWCIHSDEKYKTQSLYIFCICFYDCYNFEIGDNSYISDISKSENISGTEIVKFVLGINRKLCVKRTFLHDNAKITFNNNEYDLSLIKLLEKKQTFYTRIGFNIELSPYVSPTIRFDTKQDLLDKIDELINNIRTIKIKDVIEKYQKSLTLLLHANEVDVKLLYEPDIININIYNKKYYLNNRQELIKECDDMIGVLSNVNEEFLYMWLIKIFCSDDYEIFAKYIYNSQRYKIVGNNVEVDWTFVSWFRYLNVIRNTIFSYDL